MTSAGARSRNKGKRYELKVANYLADRLGLVITRRIDQWRDGGDDLALPPELDWLSVECKDVAAVSLGAWLDQALTSAGNRTAVVIHHRRGNGDPAHDFATLRLDHLATLVDQLLPVDGRRLYIIEAGEAIPAQHGDTATHVLTPLK